MDDVGRMTSGRQRQVPAIGRRTTIGSAGPGNGCDGIGGGGGGGGGRRGPSQATFGTDHRADWLRRVRNSLINL